MKVRLEYRDDTSNKFWEIEVSASSHTVRFGKLGTDGQAKTKQFATPAQAQADADKLVREKTKKGYRPAPAATTAPASSAPAAPPPVEDEGPLPAEGPARAAAFRGLFALEDPAAIARAVARLVAARPTARELTDYLTTIERELEKQTAAAFARAELLFQISFAPDDPQRATWLRVMNNAISRAFDRLDLAHRERWSDVARPFLSENAYLGHNLACVYVAAGRIDDALAACKAAVDRNYPHTARMRIDTDLGPLLDDPRFQALFAPPDFTAHAPRLEIPRDAALEAQMIAGDAEAYGAWLAQQGHALGELVAADLAAAAEPPRQRKAKNLAAKRFETYRSEVLAPAFPALARHFTHFLTDDYYFRFRCGFLDALDTFRLTTPAERDEVFALLADPHAMFVRHVTPRGATFEDLGLFRSLRGVRRIQFRWSDITQVTSIAPLAELTQLRALDVARSKISDLRPLASVPLLQLKASDTPIRDLAPLADHPTLSHVVLDRTQITDLRPLLSCPALCRVELWETAVPAAQVAELEAYLGERAHEPVRDPALIDGYHRGVSYRGTPT